MKLLEILKQKKINTEDLRSVVKTMKVMAAINIRQYQKAVESLEVYNKTIEMGFRIVLKNQPELLLKRQRAKKDSMGAIVFGSERGMCGQFNEMIVDYATRQLEEMWGASEKKQILVIGERAKNIYVSQSIEVEEIVFFTCQAIFFCQSLPDYGGVFSQRECQQAFCNAGGGKKHRRETRRNNHKI